MWVECLVHMPLLTEREGLLMRGYKHLAPPEQRP